MMKMNGRKMMKTALLWAALLVAAVTQAQTKIVVLTDTHVMAPELLVNDGSAWQHYLEYDPKLEDYSQQLFDAMIEQLKTETKPDMVFITGDLTKDGELLSHQYVARKLEELRQAGVKVLVVPGNHDYGTDGAVYFDGSETYPATTATRSEIEQLYSNFGFGSAFEREPTTMTYACQPFPGLTVIGIDSGVYGELSSTTLNWVCNKASEAYAATDRVIALMHHALIPHVTGIDKIPSLEAAVVDHETVRDRLIAAGVSMVFTGHLHIGDIAKDYAQDPSVLIYDVATGALVDYPNYYREVTISEDLQEIQVKTNQIRSIPGSDFSNSIARNRLQDAIRNFLRQYTGEGNILTRRIINEALNLAANAATYFAEGNEDQSSNAAQALTRLIELFNLASQFVDLDSLLEEAGLTKDDITTMIHSALENKTCYGMYGHESVTDDLTLTVPLRGLPRHDTGITSIQSSEAPTPYYSLQGVKVDKPSAGVYVKDGRLVIIRR